MIIMVNYVFIYFRLYEYKVYLTEYTIFVFDIFQDASVFADISQRV